MIHSYKLTEFMFMFRYLIRRGIGPKELDIFYAKISSIKTPLKVLHIFYMTKKKSLNFLSSGKQNL